ncbi:MAG TPA: FHA domain-containing protein [Polyangia bacterium]|nr:FHA domain-containing protein [Polyangia bacterium]
MTAPLQAAADESAPARARDSSSGQNFLELSSADMIEEGTDRSAPTTPASDTGSESSTDAQPSSSSSSSSPPVLPDSLNEQPTLIYREAPPGPKLVIIGGNDRGHEFALDRPQLTIGRGTDNDIILADIAVSRSHVVILMDGTRSTMRDLNSGNGTLVNGQRVASCVLRDGDQIELGNTLLRFVHPVPEVAPDATMPSEHVAAASTPTNDRPASAAGVVIRRTPMVTLAPQRTRMAELAAHARTAWSWVTSRVRQASPRAIAIAAGLVAMAGGSLVWRCASGPRSAAVASVPSGDVEQLFDSGVRAFRANKFQEARQTFTKLLALAPDNPRAKVYVERCGIEIASGQALDDARRALAARDYARARAALDKVDMASMAFEDAHALRARLTEESVRSKLAIAPAPPPPKMESARRPLVAGSEPRTAAKPAPPKPSPPKPASPAPAPAPRAVAPAGPKPAAPAPPRTVASSRTHPRPPPVSDLSSADLMGGEESKSKEVPPPMAPSGGYDKAAVAHYFAREWGASYQLLKSAADAQKGKNHERLLAVAEEVHKAGQAFMRAESDRSSNPAAALREYDEALEIDKRLPFSRGHHAPYLIAQLQKLSRAAAQASYAAANYEQAFQAAKSALHFAPGDAAVNKVLQDLELKAREFVNQGLMVRESNPERARLLFRRVLKFTPSTSLWYQKAYTSLNAMPKAPTDEDE